MTTILRLTSALLITLLLEVETGIIPHDIEYLPKVLHDTMKDSFICATELNSKPTDMKLFPENGQLPEDNEYLNSIWGCVWRKEGVFNENGDLNQEALKRYLMNILSLSGENSDNAEVAQKLVNECGKINGKGYGERAVKIQNCIYRYSVIDQRFLPN